MNKKTLCKSKTILGIIIAIILLISSFFKVLHIDKFYTEIDDVGVLASHKILALDEKSKVILTNDMFDLSVKVYKDGISNKLLDSPWFSIWIGYNWTYPPGQYIFYPVLIDESDSYNAKIIKGRIVSAIFSIFGVMLFIFLMFKLNKNRLSFDMLAPLSVFGFSLNYNLYAHHMSPYSASVATTVLLLILYDILIVKRQLYSRYAILAGVVFYFNYLSMLIVVAQFITHLYLSHNKLFSSIFELKYSIFLYLSIIFPALVVFFKPGKGIGHDGLTFIEDSGNILINIYHSLDNLLSAFSSVFASFTTNEAANFVFVFAILILFFYRLKDALHNSPHTTISLILFVFMWILLNTLNILVLAESRHVLILLIVVSYMLWIGIRSIKNKYFHMILSLTIILFSSINNYHLIEQRISVFDFKSLDADNRNIFVYGGTLKPILYFDNSNINVVDTNTSSFKELVSKSYDHPDTDSILVSSTMSFNDYMKTKKYKDTKVFWEKYEIESISVIETNKCFTYNDSCVSSNPNNYYSYNMKKIKNPHLN
jgi:hypothetical protein